jgi:hypothetical protein
MKTYIQASVKKEVTNYPYGRLQTSAFFSIDFSKTKGFRQVFQTVNPKTGRLNAEKKDTYHTISILTEEEGFIRQACFGFNGDKEINRALPFLSENWDLFTPEQKIYIAQKFLLHLKLEIHSIVTYCGLKFEVLKPFFEEAIKTAVQIIKTFDNLWSTIKINFEAIDALKDPNFSPFKISKAISLFTL